MTAKIDLGRFSIGGGSGPVIFGGPCVLEGERETVDLAVRLARIAEQRSLHLVFKASFDKANRTALSSYRGPGLEAGLRILETVRRETGLDVLTDVHDPTQVERVAGVVQLIQVPAFLCRQTDLLVAAGGSRKPVNIKKGQFMAPQDMAFAVDKVRSAGGRPLVTERGTTFGYRDLVVDMRSLVWMREHGVPVVFDGTHSVQQPGAAGGRSGGNRDMVAPLVRAAVAVGVDGIYLEAHPDPDRAPSDGPNSLSPDMFARVLDEVAAFSRVSRP